MTSYYRSLILATGVIYLVWWVTVQVFLPGAFNPLGSRLAVVFFCLAAFAASFLVPAVRRRLFEWHFACVCLMTIHYFYLFQGNRADIDWVVGSYITVIAVAACLQSARALFAYSLGVLALSVALIARNPFLSRTIFLPGMVTIVALAYFGLRSRIRLLERETDFSRRIQSLFDAVFEGIVVFDRGVVADSNESFARIFGYERREVIGRSATDFFVPELRSAVRERLESAVESPYESIGVRKDGSPVPIEIAGKHHVFDGKELRLSAVRDLTERKKSEENRIRYEKAREALRIREEFISIASHELRTPLTGMKIQTDLAARLVAKNDPEVFNPDRVRKLVAFTDRNVNKLVTLVEEMLDVSRIASGNLDLARERFDLRELVREAVRGIRDAIPAGGVAVELVCDESPVLVHADRSRLEQVVANLLGNAMKYGQGRPVRASVSANGREALFSVQDEGIGIAEANQSRIFEKFERAVSNDNISGLGLGLYISQQIVRAHGGTISVASRLGEGARFTVTLPRA
jgi:PAS domain S-box-containing protein